MTVLPSYVKVFAPATVANVASGFDVLGFAVSHPGDTVEAFSRVAHGVTLQGITGDRGRLPQGEGNTVVVAVRELLRRLEKPFGVDIVLHKGMPLSSGVGGSAASAAAALHAVNVLAGEPLSPEELLRCSLEAERVVSGSGHADNAAPALLGGFVLVRSTDPLDVMTLPVPPGLTVVLLSPDIEISTAVARRMLPTKIPLKDAISQLGNLAALVASLFSDNLALMGRSLSDLIAEPIRAELIPGFKGVKKAALAAGALGCSISGSGPAMFALVGTVTQAEVVAKEMQNGFKVAGLKATSYISEVGAAGPRVVEKG